LWNAGAINESSKNYWNYNSTIETAERNGEAKGRVEGRAEGERSMAMGTARKMKADGMTAAIIAKYTGLAIEEIEAL